MDLLSAVLRELRLASAAYFVMELEAPWRVRFDGGCEVCTSWTRAAACSVSTERSRGRWRRATWSSCRARTPTSCGPRTAPLDAALVVRAGRPGIRPPGHRPRPGGQTRLLCGAFTMDD